MVATSLACHSPAASGLMSQSFEVSAVAVIAQLSPSFSDQRISSGAPGTARTFLGVIALRSHTHHRVAEVLHGLGVADQLAELRM